MILTEELIRNGLTKGVGLAQGQARVLGIKPKKGWLKSLIGREVSQEVYDKFLLIGDMNRKRKLSTKNKKSKKKKRKKRAFANSDKFLESYEWRKLRLVAIQKYGRKCLCCGATPETGAIIHVDHIKPRRFYPDLALDINNLQVLCHECNHGKGNWDETDYRPSELPDELTKEFRLIIGGKGV